ncbi:hypothetical protein [Kosakonia virus Kc318]|uniref:Uncharacterized protein n=1 Tax=Kosakonia virus Kc318 TaxID=2797327 RepID=A0AAE7TQ88_9CAUD|nr:hypothetical protein [Kosakonia virus Kc318]
MNPIVWSTCPGMQVEPIQRSESMREWEERPRRTKREQRDAQNALNIEYRRRANAVGMSLDAYCARFHITLK